MSRQRNHSVEITVNANGIGRASVLQDAHSIELVKIEAHHGYPHVYSEGIDPSGKPRSCIEVLGAIPDSRLTVSYYVED